MVKGVNRRVIEVKMPKDSGFDKALLYLSTEMNHSCNEDTEKILSDICTYDEKDMKTSLPIIIMSVLTGLTAIAFMVVLFLYLSVA